MRPRLPACRAALRALSRGQGQGAAGSQRRLSATFGPPPSSPAHAVTEQEVCYLFVVDFAGANGTFRM